MGLPFETASSVDESGNKLTAGRCDMLEIWPDHFDCALRERFERTAAEITALIQPRLFDLLAA